MDYLAFMDSGNYVFNLCRILEGKGYVFEVISTPCQIATYGCGYCLKFPSDYLNIVLKAATENNVAIREVYGITPLYTKNRYDKVF